MSYRNKHIILKTLSAISLPIVLASGVSLCVPQSRDYILNHIAPHSAVYKKQAEELDKANKTIESQQQEITNLTLSLGSYKAEINKIRIELSQSNANNEQLKNKLNVVYSNVELLYDTYNMSLPAGETLAETRDEQINQKCTAIAKFIEDLLNQSEDPVELSAGLYTTGTNTLVKSWDNLLAEGDITFTDGQLKVANNGLAGDLVCGSVEGLTSLQRTFYSCIKLTSIDLSNLDTSNVTNMVDMFRGCSSLTSLDISGFDTSKVTNMATMFDRCSKLISLDLSNFDTSNVTDMSNMFRGCSSLTNIDLSSFNTVNVTNISGMFTNCYSLESLCLSNFDTVNVLNKETLFINCGNLTSITYNGTIAEWKAKNITNETADIKEDGTVTVHCSDGDYTITASTAE